MPERTLCIRADASAGIGAGHVMRCLALAQEWRREGPVRFVGRIGSEALRARLKGEGVDLADMPGEPGSGADLDLLLAEAGRTPGAWIVLDGYRFGPDYQQGAMEAGHKVLVVDDYAHLPRYQADILLNQNIGAQGLDYALNPEADRLLGPGYALIRREFLEAREEKDASGPAARLLLTMGGGDPDNATGRLLEMLPDLAPGLGIRAVVGPANPHRETLDRIVAAFPAGAVELVTRADMPALMRWADLAVTAAGSTCWELLFMGVPFLSVTLADNQRGIAAGLAALDAAPALGWHGDLDPEACRSAIRGFLLDRQARARAVEQGRTLVDGLGARRVMERMLWRAGERTRAESRTS